MVGNQFQRENRSEVFKIKLGELLAQVEAGCAALLAVGLLEQLLLRPLVVRVIFVGLVQYERDVVILLVPCCK